MLFDPESFLSKKILVSSRNTTSGQWSHFGMAKHIAPHPITICFTLDLLKPRSDLASENEQFCRDTS